jgi:hypothetical protein
MPWVLLALLAGAGGIYYEANKGRASNTRWELHFPASSVAILSGLMDAVTPLGGTVLDKGQGVYVVSVPAKVDLSHALPPNLVPQNIVISGANLQSFLQSDDRMPEIDDLTGAPPWVPPGPHEVIVAGMRWNGTTLR